MAMNDDNITEQGCEWCNAGIFSGSMVGVGEFFGQKKVMLSGGNSQFPEDKQFKLCPMCGRPLKDLERGAGK